MFGFFSKDFCKLQFRAEISEQLSCFCPQSNTVHLILSTVFSSQPHQQCLSHGFIFCLFPGLTAGDKISPVEDRISRTEGESVTLKCEYETSYNNVYLYWYRRHSDLQPPQFILWKGARKITSEHIPDKRYESTTSRTETELTIRNLTPADTALYYCALETQ